MLGACAVAVLLALVSLVVRYIDSSQPSVDDGALEQAKMGVYADTDTIVAMQYRTVNEFATPPPIRWNVALTPSKSTAVRATLLLGSGKGLWDLDIDSPLTVVAVFPKGSTWGTTDSDLMPDGRNCASWYDGERADVSEPEMLTSFDGAVIVVCKVPAVGKVESLTFDIRMRFRDEVAENYGVGRTQSGVRIDASWIPDSDAQEFGLTYGLRQPVELQLELPDGFQLLNSFPEPSGGSAASRSWRIGTGAQGADEAGVMLGDDVVYQLEEPRKRIWVQPTIDLSLLLAGVAFGLAPLFKRRVSA